jgi:hypothetical protein
LPSLAATIAVGVLQTIPGHENDFATLKLFAVVIFTLKYNLVGAGADPAFARPGADTSQPGPGTRRRSTPSSTSSPSSHSASRATA